MDIRSRVGLLRLRRRGVVVVVGVLWGTFTRGLLGSSRAQLLRRGLGVEGGAWRSSDLGECNQVGAAGGGALTAFLEPLGPASAQQSPKPSKNPSACCSNTPVSQGSGIRKTSVFSGLKKTVVACKAAGADGRDAPHSGPVRTC